MLNPDSIYTFQNAGSGKMLNLYGSASDGKNVVQYDADGSDEQRWKYTGNKLLTMRNTNFALDRYRGSGSYNNADVWTESSSENSDQCVYIRDYPDGTCHIVLASTLGDQDELRLTAYGSGNGTASGKSSTSNGNVFWAAPTYDDYQNWYYTEEGSSSGGETPEPSQTQRLIMPLNQSVITVCYKENAPGYHEQAQIYGFSDPMHYGVDMYGGLDFYASGNGTILGYSNLDAGLGSMGRWLAIRYNNVIDIHGNNIGDVVLRYCHLEKIYKTSGTVTIDDKIARIGKTGGMDKIHLHVEVDTNVVNYNYTPSLSDGLHKSNGLVGSKSNDTTIDPFEVFYKKTSAPENQTVTGSQSYCDLGTGCSGCKKYDYPVGRVPYINENQCNNVPVLPE